MKNSLFPLFLLALLPLLVSACDTQEAKHEKKAAAKAVVVLNVAPIDFFDVIQTLGTTQANEAINITAKTTGTLEKINFTDGQYVKQGDIIALLDQDEEQAQLATAKIQLAEHEREITRLNTLLTRHAAPVRDLDERKTLAAVTASNLKAIQARINELTLTAPFSGKLGIRHVSKGALIQAGTIITTLDQTNPLKIDFAIPARQLSGIKVGTAIEVATDVLPQQVIKGFITALDSRINPTTRTMLLRATVDNPENLLLPGMMVSVRILTHQRQALVVPEESVTQKQTQHFLTLVGANNTVEQRVVDIGQRRFGLVEIVSGLNAGEKVIVRGMGFVKAGTEVSISQTWDNIRDAQYPQQKQ